MKPGSMVKLLRSMGRNRHGTPAILIAVDGDKATVKPIGHKHNEVVPLSQVKLWKSRN